MNIFGFHICMDEIMLVLPFLPACALAFRSARERVVAGVRAVVARGL